MNTPSKIPSINPEYSNMKYILEDMLAPINWEKRTRTLSAKGVVELHEIIHKYTGAEIQRYSGQTVHAFNGYVTGRINIGEKGLQCLTKLVEKANNDYLGIKTESVKKLTSISDEELIQELKARGYRIFKEI